MNMLKLREATLISTVPRQKDTLTYKTRYAQKNCLFSKPKIVRVFFGKFERIRFQVLPNSLFFCLA